MLLVRGPHAFPMLPTLARTDEPRVAMTSLDWNTDALHAPGFVPEAVTVGAAKMLHKSLAFASKRKRSCSLIIPYMSF